MNVGFRRRGYDVVVAYLKMRCRVDSCLCTVLQLIVIIIMARGTLMGGINLAGLTSNIQLSLLRADRSMATHLPSSRFFSSFFYESTITQVLSCTLHMLNTVTCIATGVLIGLGKPVLHREARYNGWGARWGRGRIHCLQSVQLCMQKG
jgi:hypothetical protein